MRRGGVGLNVQVEERVSERKQLVPGKGLTAGSRPEPEAGPSEGLPPPALPSARDRSAPETGWNLERRCAQSCLPGAGQFHPSQGHPVVQESWCNLPSPCSSPTNLTTPRGRGRCSLTLRAWLQRKKEQSQSLEGSE